MHGTQGRMLRRTGGRALNHARQGGGAGGGTRKMGEARTSQLVHVAILWALFPEVGAGALAPHAACARSRTSCRCQMGSSVPTSSVRGVEWC